MILVYAGVVPRKAGAPGLDPTLIERSQILLHQLRNEIVVLPMVAVSGNRSHPGMTFSRN